MITILLSSFSLGLIIPVLVILLVSKGILVKDVSALMIVYTAFVIVMEIPSGIFADHFGKLTSINFSLLSSALSSALLLLGDRFALICIAIVLAALGKSFSSGSLEALIINDEKQERDIRTITSRLQLYQVLGIACGSILGGFLGSIEGSGFNLLLVLRIFILAVVLVLLNATFSKIPGSNAYARHGHVLNDSFALVKNSDRVRKLFMAAAVLGFVLGGIETYWQIKYMTLSPGGAYRALIGVPPFLAFLTASAGNLIANKLPVLSTAQNTTIYIAGGAALSSLLIVLGLSENFFLFIFIFIFWYCILGFVNVFEGTLINHAADDKNRATLMSALSFFFQIGGLLFNVLATLLYAALNIDLLWIFAGALGLIMIMAVGVSSRFDRRRGGNMACGAGAGRM